MRQVVLDTETTGLEVANGHRIVEIGAVELINRRLTGRNFHKYINPDRDIDDGAKEVHGITEAFLDDKPRFADIWTELYAFLRDSELVIHNAPFDIGFLNAEISWLPDSGSLEFSCVEDFCEITDSLSLARRIHPGQKNSLDALCRRYMVDNSQRDFHGALLDAEILADVFLLMTGGQAQMFGAASDQDALETRELTASIPPINTEKLRVIRARPEEIAAHQEMLDLLDNHSDGETLWRRLNVRPS